MDLRSHEGQIIQEGEEKLSLRGYTRDQRKTVVTWIAIILSAFLLRLIFHWKPGWFLKATHKPTSLRQAEKILVENQFGDVRVHNVHLTTRDGSAVKLLNLKHRKRGTILDVAYEMETPYQDDSLLRYFVNKKLKYLWNWESDYFERVKSLNEALPADPHCLPHLSFRQAMQRRVLYGLNVIDVPITPLIKVLVLQALHPFYVFQVFSCVLWYFDEYWKYATCIVAESILSLSFAVFETRRNESQLRNTITSSGFCIVQREGEFREMSTELLVPGDIIKLPRTGCEMSCDAVIISGNAIVNESLLTGESVPVSKVPLPFKDDNGREPLRTIDIKENERHIVFNGTSVIQTRNYENEPVRAVVLRTGFSTAKGELVRSIMFPKPMKFRFDSDIINYLIVLSIFGFIGFIFTIVLMVSYHKPTSLIVRRALDIFTIIVPPALPAAMSVGLGMSLRRLKANRIFCIAPRSINATGCVNLVAFDKTGTLTEEGLDFRRVIYPEPDGVHEEKDVTMLDPRSPVVMCMAAAHSLATIDGQVCGDPIDMKMFSAIGWRLDEPVLGMTEDGGDTVQQMVPRVVTFQGPQTQAGLTHSIGLLREFPFSSSLQRMAVLGRILGKPHFTLFVKGSPEAVCSLSRPETIPAGLDARLDLYTQRGFRVLALAWRPMEKLSVVRVHRISREDVEKDLLFVGLLVMENRLKPESSPTIATLKAAKMRLVMVTGDNVLTALSVAQDCGIIEPQDRVISVSTLKHEDRPMDILYHEVCNNVNQRPASDSEATAADILLRTPRMDAQKQPGKNAKIHLSVTGRVWADIRQHRPEVIHKLVVLGSVFARFSPEQKAQLIEELQAIDYSVAMCGDGANDCGALKAAHSGISLSEAEASVASPFTSKEQNISCTVRLIREGRCALVASFGIFKFMAGYSLTQFISVLILYWLKLNFSDGQYLYSDLFIITSLSITFGYTRPAKGLHPILPPRRLITIPVILSIILLQGVNLVVQLLALQFVEKQPWFVPRDEKKAVIDEEYDSYENTVIFAVSAFQYITLAIIFSKAYPYRRHLCTNYLFVLNILILLFFTFYICLDPLPFLKTQLELVDTPNGYGAHNDLRFRGILVGMASANFLLCALIEWGIDSISFRQIITRLEKRKLLPWTKPKKYVVIKKTIKEHSWPLGELERTSSVTESAPTDFVSIEKESDIYSHSEPSRRRVNDFEMESCSMTKI